MKPRIWKVKDPSPATHPWALDTGLEVWLFCTWRRALIAALMWIGRDRPGREPRHQAQVA